MAVGGPLPAGGPTHPSYPSINRGIGGVKTLRTQDTSDLRHFGTTVMVPKCPDTSALVPKCLRSEVS